MHHMQNIYVSLYHGLVRGYCPKSCQRIASSNKIHIRRMEAVVRCSHLQLGLLLALS